MSDTGPNLTDLGPFEPGLSTTLRGQRMEWLTKAAQDVYDARRAGIPVLIANCQEPEARARCLAAVNALPAKSLRLLISKYIAKSKGR